MREVSDQLSRTYQNPRLRNKINPIDELIFILLSAKTAERSYLRTYASLRRKFRPWSKILEAAPRDVVDVIAEGGLAEKKERQIRSMISAIQGRRGKVSLSFLSKLPDWES